MGGKHSSDNSRDIDIDMDVESDFSTINVGKIVKIVAIVIAIALVVIFAILFIKTLEKNSKLDNGDNLNNSQENSLMPAKIGEYKVLGKLVIEKIKLEQYILEKTDEKSLKEGLTKLYGETINMTGNFCITGHNTEGMFKDLEKLEKNDTFYIEDSKGKKITYKVSDKYSVQSDDLKCLMPNDKEKEVTLITCEQGAQTKLIVKAKEETNKEQSKTENSNNKNQNTTAEEKNNTTSENKVTNENTSSEDKNTQE